MLFIVIVVGALMVWRSLGNSLSKQMGVATERFGVMQNDGSRTASTAIGELIRPPVWHPAAMQRIRPA